MLYSERDNGSFRNGFASTSTVELANKSCTLFMMGTAYAHDHFCVND